MPSSVSASPLGDVIFDRRHGPPEPTAGMVSELVCLICGSDYRSAPDAEAVVVSHRDDKQQLTCHGTCRFLYGPFLPHRGRAPVP